MINVRDTAHAYKYTTHNNAIYRGINPRAKFSKSDYKKGEFGQWGCFSSCTKNEKMAL